MSVGRSRRSNRSVKRLAYPVLRTYTTYGLTQNLLPTRDILTFRNAHTRIRIFDWSWS